MHLISRQINLLWRMAGGSYSLVSKTTCKMDTYSKLWNNLIFEKNERPLCFRKKKSLTDSFPIFFCSRVCHWTACMTMASHLLSRFTMISCMGWWSALRLQVSPSSRRCWHNRRMEATPRRRCFISQQRDCNTGRDRSMSVYGAEFPQTQDTMLPL